MTLTLPPETSYSDTEIDWINTEPAGRFPTDQSSFWGQARKVFADYLQTSIVNAMDAFELARQVSTCTADEIHNWEQMYGLPIDTTKTLAYRRALVQIRSYRGPFTRAQRKKVIEFFIFVTYGPEIEFTLDGIVFPDGAGTDTGMPFFIAPGSFATFYEVVENIPGFSYNVKFVTALDGSVDEGGLTRELERLTPAPITFTITYDL